MIKGILKTCPRCKGNGYILGQKRDLNTNFESFLPNYEQNKKGLCFLCDGKKEAFFTYDNRVIKFKKNKKGNSILIEFCPYEGSLIGEIDSSEYEEMKKYYENFITPEELLFPEDYEVLIGESSPIIDAILKEYKNAKVIKITQGIQEYAEYFAEYFIDFTLYYDKDFNLIKPFFTKPIFTEYDSETLCIGTVLAKDDNSISISGSYYEKDDYVYLGIKSKYKFKDDVILDFSKTFNIHKNTLYFKNKNIFNFENDEELFTKLAVKVIKDIKDLTNVSIIF